MDKGFLNNRKLAVIINGINRVNKISVSSVALQGSVLDPIHFLAY